MTAYSNPLPTFTSGEALEADRFVKFSTTTVIYADAGDEPIGITTVAVATATPVAVVPINAAGVVRATAGAAVAAGAAIYTANDGKVSSSAVGRRIGTNGVTASSADGGKLSVMLNAFAGAIIGTDSSVARFREDFFTGSLEDGHKFSTTADKGDWLSVSIDGDGDAAEVVNVADDAHGGILTITTNNKAVDAEQLQLNGESFTLTSGKQLYMETSFAVEDVDKADIFIGLSITDTTVMAGVTDRIGVQMLHDGNIKALVEKDSTETLTDTTVNITDATLATFATTSVKVGMLYDGDEDEVRVFVNDVYKITLAAANIPDDEALTPTIAILATSTEAPSLWVDYFNVDMER